MFARDLLDLPATKVLTQSKVRRIFYENVLNLSRSQFLQLLFAWYDAIHFFQVHLDSKLPFIIFSAISHFIYFIFKWRVLRLKHKWTWSKAKFELQIKIRGWVMTKWNASIANEFSFYSFCFQTVDTNFKIFSLPYTQSWIRNVCKGIFQKKGRDLN